MPRIIRIIPALAIALSLTTACDKKPDEKKADDKKADAKKSDAKAGDAKAGDAKADDAKADDAKAAAGPATKAWLAVEKYGVQIEVPEGATVADGAGTSVMISAPDGSCTVMLSKKDDSSFFPSYDSTIERIEKGSGGKKKEMITNEKTDDANWTVHYTKEALTDPTRTQHAVDVRKKVGDAEYSCSRIQDSEDDAKCVLHACQSIKA